MGRKRHRKKAAAAAVAAAAAPVASLPVDMLANIHACLSLLDRLTLAAVFRTSRDAFKPEAPCLLLHGTIFSLSERRAAAVRAPGPDHAVLGSSSRGRLVTADDRARLCLLNPVTGERRALPAIDTTPHIFAHGGRHHFTVDVKWFLRGPPPYPYGTMTYTTERVRHALYRKVVLSDSADVAMLITGPEYGVAAFATATGGAWRLAPPRDGIEPIPTSEAGSWRLWHSRNGVEDAVHHEGRFYSVTYSGEVEAWEEREADAAGVFTSAVVAPSLLLPADTDHRKYLVVAPAGRLMVVLKETTGRRTSPSFKVQVLDASRQGWKETDDIGNTALFVAVNGSLCVSTMEHPELKAGCVYYYTEDDLGPCKDARDDDEEENGVRVFSLKDRRTETVEGLGWGRSWPPPAWFIPSIP
ncbi:uncharacterized protein [Aegilops tauschii subsp. strangulata]|nr:uncharacterized protein LOC109750568 [Aegilops tauschii subsp. strangulata]